MEIKKRSKKEAAQYQKVRFVSPQVSDQQYYQASPESVQDFYQKPIKKQKKRIVYEQSESDEEPQYYQAAPKGQILYSQPIQQLPVQSTRVQRGQDFDRWNSVYKRQEIQNQQQYLQSARPIEKKKRKKKVIIVEEEEEESEQEEEEQIIVKKVPKKRKEPRVLEPRQQLLLKEQEVRERQRSRSAQRYPSKHMAPIYEDQEESEQEYKPSRKTVKPINFEPLFVQKKEGIKAEEEQWEVKATKEGFIQFHLKNSRTFQYEFPTFFDQKSRKTRHMFVHNWVKKRDQMGTKFYQHKKTEHKQYEKPYKPTYLIAAAQTNNLAFLELYLKVRGSLQITDQTGRTALHHAVGNGNKEFATLLCEFSWRDQQIIEGIDNSGNSPLFIAVRYDQVECIKVLISYGADLFQKGKMGNTLMHQAAFHNASNSAVLISTYSGSELLRVRNHEGYRPIDISRLKQNQEMTDALQKLERNLTISDALLEREAKQFISQPSKIKEPFQKGYKKQRKVVQEESETEEENNPLHVLKNKEEMIYGKKRQRIIESEASSQEEQEQLNLQEARFKQKAQQDQRKMEIMRDHERDFKIKSQKDKQRDKKERKEQKQEELVGPTFKKYNTQRDHYKVEKKQKYKKGQIVPFEESSDAQFESQKKRRSMVRDQSQDFQQNKFDKSKSYINLELNPDDSQNRSRRQQPSRILQDLQDSQFDMTRDYEAQRIVRVKSRGRSKSNRESQVPQAVSNFFGLVSTNFNKFKEFMWQDPMKRSSSSDDQSQGKKTKRSKSSIRDVEFLSADDSFEFERKQQEEIREKRKQKVVYLKQQQEQTEEDETSFEDSRAEYILPQNRSKKSLTRISEEPSSFQDKSTARKENSLIRKFDEEQEYEARKFQKEETIVEESMVTDSQIVNSRRGKKKKKKKKSQAVQRDDSEASKKSIGVGSHKVDETLLGSANLSQTRSFNKQLKAQRLAEKGKQILKRKAYMSSEEESKGQTYIRMRSPSPGPQFMKEEVGYLQATELEQKPVEQFIREQEERQALQLQQVQRTPTARYQISSQDKIQRSSGDQRNLISASRGETTHQQQDSSKSHNTQLSQKGSEMKLGAVGGGTEKKEIRKFYEDLVGDQTTLVQEQIQPMQASKAVEETQDISQIYNRVMKGVNLDISGEIQNDSAQDIIMRQSVNSSTHDQFFSFLGDLQKDKDLSQLSFIEGEVFQSQSKFQQSNFLDKGQYLQQSQNLQKSLIQNSSMAKIGNKLFFQGGNNNSMLNFQYQSDNDKQNSPGKKQPKIPPRQISNLKESADKQKALQLLFTSDDELVQNLESQKSQSKQKTPLLLPIPPQSTSSQKPLTQSQVLQDTARNPIQTSSSGIEDNNNMKKSSDFAPKIEEEEKKKQESELSSKKKTNNRYDQEESLIQFDISNTQNQIPMLQSKVEEYTIMSSESDQSLQSIHLPADLSIQGEQDWQQEENQIEAEGFLSKKGLLSGIMGSAFSGTATGNKISQNRSKLNKYGSSIQTQVTQKKLGVGSKAAVQETQISKEKLQNILADDLEFLSDSELTEKSPRQQLKQEQNRVSTNSLRNNLLTQSQEGVLDDLIDISRDKFQPLEVVQEESRTIQDITYDQQTPKASMIEEEEKVTQIFSQSQGQEQDSKRSAMRISSRYEQEDLDDQVIQTSMEFQRLPKIDQQKKQEQPLTQDEFNQRKFSPHPQMLKRQEQQAQSNNLNSSRGSGKKPGSAGETSQQIINPIQISPLKSTKAANSAFQTQGFFRSGNESEEERVHDGLAPNLQAWQQQFMQNRSVLQQHLYGQSNSEDESRRQNPMFQGTKMRVRIPKNPLAQSTLPSGKNLTMNQGQKKSVKDISYKPKEQADSKVSNISQMSSTSDKTKSNLKAFLGNKLGLMRKKTETKEDLKEPIQEEKKQQKKAFGSTGANSKGSAGAHSRGSAKGSSGGAEVELLQLQGSQEDQHSIDMYPPKRKSRKL